MPQPGINQEIVEQRQQKAPLLTSVADACDHLLDRCGKLVAAMDRLQGSDGPEMPQVRNDLEQIMADLDHLHSRARMRWQRFSNGLITVAIAGLEKAGKTTFLRSLTGIDALPAFDERCTAVCCEIHYDSDRQDFDLEFYTEDEFLERVIQPAVETIAAGIGEHATTSITLPASITDFLTMSLPDVKDIPVGTTAYKLLTDLVRLRDHFHECRKYLGRPALTRQPLSELRSWVSYPPSQLADVPVNHESVRAAQMARISAAKVCRMYIPFAGGSAHLRWIDTPGVDDPNRRARDLTLATIAMETDLLVVASRPGANPSPGESFHRFWDSVSRLPDEVDILHRLLFVLNWDRRVDPEGENISIHRKYLMDAGVPRHLFLGPFEATRSQDAALLMDAVNAHLKQYLPGQDDTVVESIEAGLKTLQARLRLICDRLGKMHPSDSGFEELENEAFQKWFHWYQDDHATGFWTELVASLDMSVRGISSDSRIHESETALYTIFAEEAEAIQSRIPSPEALQEFIITHRGENPIPSGMRAISTHLSRLINRLSNEIQEFGPIMQDEMVAVFTRAGLEPLLCGASSAEKLQALLDNFAKRRPGSPVVELLRETLDLPRNIKYVLRYELRAAVDFCDPTLWNEEETAWNRLRDMIASNNGDVDRLATFDTHRHPPVSDSRETDARILKQIAGNALLGIQTVLNNERYLPRRIADDFMRDCRVRLCFSPESEQEWRLLLYANRADLVAGAIGNIRAGSQRIQAFVQALRQLESALP